MERPEPTEQHRWLQAFEGDWTWESWSIPDDPKCRWTGAETVSRYGGIWTVFESRNRLPDGSGMDGGNRITLGFDPVKDRFVGCFVSSMTTTFWPYEGSLDDDGLTLRLRSRGPRMDGQPGEAEYEDVIEVVSPDERFLRGTMLNDDGSATEFMVTHYKRRGSAA